MLLNTSRKYLPVLKEKTSKEKPEIFLKAAEYMGTNPKETMVFEDALYALKTAKAAGFVTVGVYDKSSSDNRKRLRTLVIFI